MRGGRRPNNKKSPRKRGKKLRDGFCRERAKSTARKWTPDPNQSEFLFSFFVLSPADVSRALSIRGNGEWRYRVSLGPSYVRWKAKEDIFVSPRVCGPNGHMGSSTTKRVSVQKL